jgi:hypothetical protein
MPSTNVTPIKTIVSSAIAFLIRVAKRISRPGAGPKVCGV